MRIISRNSFRSFALVAVVACADDPQSPPNTVEPAELRVSAVVTHFSEDDRRLEVFGWAELDRGLRSDGTPHPFVDDTLWIMGDPVVWSGRDSLEFFLRPPEARMREEFVIRAPELAGLGPAPELRVPLARRSNPDTTFLRQGEEPVIHLVVPLRRELGGLSYELWGLELLWWDRALPPEVLQARFEDGAPPEEIRFPDEVLPLSELTEASVFYSLIPDSGSRLSSQFRMVPSIKVTQFLVFVPGSES